ncbi:MAG: hypothetical protein OQK25_00965 [Gammaproteobacteria bacterium]|nr:hypothetical protein [Gammaproteobacteria bacterium]
MDSGQNSNALIKWLSGLYSDVVLIIFKRRIDSYRTRAQANDGSEIHRNLSAQIDKLSAAERKSNDGVGEVDVPSVTGTIESIKKAHSIKNLFRMWNSLGGYFRKSPRGSTSNSHMGTRLKESVWDHVHAALRLARQGKVEQARFHTDIVHSGLKEVGHYLDEEEFKAFSDEIEASLKKI